MGKVKHYTFAALDYRDRINTNGGTISEDTLRAIDDFVRDLQVRNLWDDLVEIGPFAGNTLLAALVKLKYPAARSGVLTNVNFVAADYTELGERGGLQGGAGKYLKADTRPSDLFTSGDGTGSLFFLSRSNPGGVGSGQIGSNHNDTDGATLAQSGTDLSFLFRGDAGDGPIYSVANSFGCFGGVAYDATHRLLFLNGRQVATATQASGITGTLEFYIFAENDDGAPSSSWTGLAGFYALGNKNFNVTRMISLFDAVNTLQAKLLRTGSRTALGDPDKALGEGSFKLGT
jgi:hypothetical protein